MLTEAELKRVSSALVKSIRVLVAVRKMVVDAGVDLPWIKDTERLCRDGGHYVQRELRDREAGSKEPGG